MLLPVSSISTMINGWTGRCLPRTQRNGGGLCDPNSEARIRSCMNSDQCCKPLNSGHPSTPFGRHPPNQASASLKQPFTLRCPGPNACRKQSRGSRNRRDSQKAWSRPLVACSSPLLLRLVLGSDCGSPGESESGGHNPLPLALQVRDSRGIARVGKKHVAQLGTASDPISDAVPRTCADGQRSNVGLTRLARGGAGCGHPVPGLRGTFSPLQAPLGTGRGGSRVQSERTATASVKRATRHEHSQRG